MTSRPLSSDWHSHYKHVGGGPLLHDGTHLMDMLSFLGGEVNWVFGHIERKTKDIYVEDTATAFLHFRSGAHAIIESGGDRNYFNFEIDIQGSKGRIIVGNGIMCMKMADVSPHHTGFMELAPYSFPMPDNNCNPHIDQIKELIECIEKDKESISSGYEGRKALELVMAVYESARLDGKKVELPLKIKYSPLERMFKEEKI